MRHACPETYYPCRRKCGDGPCVLAEEVYNASRRARLVRWILAHILVFCVGFFGAIAWYIR